VAHYLWPTVYICVMIIVKAWHITAMSEGRDFNSGAEIAAHCD